MGTSQEKLLDGLDKTEEKDVTVETVRFNRIDQLVDAAMSSEEDIILP